MIDFSIICPFYNSEVFIKETIESVVAQDCCSWELILVNDGSNDSSKKICEQYSIHDNRIKLFNKINEGPYKARLFGISAARGDYILFLDSDDLLCDGALSFLKGIIIKESPDLICFEYTRNRELLKKFNNQSIATARIQGRDKIISHFFIDNLSLNLWSKCYKKSLFQRKYDILNIKYSEDTRFLFDTICDASTLIATNLILLFYRENPLSITHNLSYNDAYDCWKTNEYIYSSIYQDGIILEKISSKNLLINLLWCLFMVIWLAPKNREIIVFNEIKKSSLFNILKNSEKPRVKFIVNRITKNFFNSHYKIIMAYKRIFLFFKRKK